MSEDNRSILRKFTDRLFGGLNMSWTAVIIFAVVTAVITAVFLIFPVFENTSFHKMGETVEAWILFAVIIMANCKSPMESSLKTFVFFLISQPLIYLLQVPFASLGWGLFGYYKYWLILTFCTLPAAYIGWYIRKKNWLSLLILSPVLLLLVATAVPALRHAIMHFPNQILTALFCIGQVLLYLYAFVPDRKLNLAGLAVCAAVFIWLTMQPRVNLDGTSFLPDNPSFTDEAVVIMNDTDIAQVTIAATGPDSMVRIQAHKYGKTGFTVQDGGQEYHYTLEVWEDESGHSQTTITRE